MDTIIKLVAAIFMLTALGGYSVAQDVRSTQQNEKMTYLYIQALEENTAGNIEKSINLLQQCISLDPTVAAPQFQLARILSTHKGDPQVINALLSSATELEPSNEWYLAELAHFYLNRNLLEPALSVYQKLADLKPKDAEYNFTLAQLLVENKKLKQAVDVFDKLYSLLGDDMSIFVRRHDILMQLGDNKRALAEINTMIKKVPNDYRYYLILGDFFYKTNKKTKAEKVYLDALKRFPDNGNLHWTLAGLYELNKEKSKFNKHLQKAFMGADLSVDKKLEFLSANLSKDSIPSHVEWDKLIDILVSENANDVMVNDFVGRYYHFQEEYAKAMQYFKVVIEQDPSQKEIWQEYLIYKLNDTTVSEAVLDSLCTQAIEVHPSYPFFYLVKGTINYQMDSLVLAEGLFKKALSYCLVKEDEPIKINILISLSELYYAQKKYDLTFKTFDEILSIDPDNLLILNNYAYYLAEHGDRLPKAESMSEKTILLEPQNPVYLDTYAWVLYKRGKYQEAYHVIRKAIEFLDKESVVYEEHYGYILYELSMYKEALAAWKKALELGSESEDIVEKIEEISLKIE